MTRFFRFFATVLVLALVMLHIHREALAALTFLIGAIKTETATLDVVEGVERYLRKAANRPELRFAESES